jgi:hypothetical protein
MTMLAEDYDYVIGGDPDRDTIDLAVLDRAHLIATTDKTGYAQVLGWANQHSTGRRVWALEGTGSFAAGLATALAQAGEDVVEVGGLAARAEPRMIDSTRSALRAQPWPVIIKPALGPGEYAKRSVPSQRPATPLLLAAPRQLTNSRASLSSRLSMCAPIFAAARWPSS